MNQRYTGRGAIDKGIVTKKNILPPRRKKPCTKVRGFLLD